MGSIANMPCYHSPVYAVSVPDEQRTAALLNIHTPNRLLLLIGLYFGIICFLIQDDSETHT